MLRTCIWYCMGIGKTGLSTLQFILGRYLFDVFAQYINNCYFVNLIKKYTKYWYIVIILGHSGTLPRSKSIATKNIYIFIYLYTLLCIIICMEDGSALIILLPWFSRNVYIQRVYVDLSTCLSRYKLNILVF